MVQVLLDGLRADPQFEVHHVDARVSDDLEDLGSFRPQKFIRLFKYILQAWWIRFRHGPMAFYYVPAPAKWSAILRDWVVMALCRPLFPELILHWHAYGLGEWVSTRNDWVRRLTRRVLGKADLSIVLNNYNTRDAEVFAPQRIAVVPNGIEDLFPDYDESLRARREARAISLRHLGLPPSIFYDVARRRDKEGLERVRFLFLGHLIESKGVLVAVEATRTANEELRKSNAPWRAHLILAGSFISEEDKGRIFAAITSANEAAGNEGPCVELTGFLDSGQKKSALEKADCLIFPTFYENEAQPLVLLEAMSAGLPVITTSWRGVPEVLPEGYAPVVKSKSADELAGAFGMQWFGEGNALRRHYQVRFTVPTHVAKLTEALIGRTMQLQRRTRRSL